MESEPVDIEKVVREANRSDLYRRTGISLSGVSRILSGNRAASVHNLATIALCLGVTMDQLYQYLNKLRKRRATRSARRTRHVAA